VFQVMPQGSPGLSEYTLVIDGQTLRYRNTAPEWTQMVWPNASGVAGARLAALTNDGRSVELINEPGNNGLGRLLETAQRRAMPDGSFELSWSKDAFRVTLLLKVLRRPGEAPRAAAAGGPGGGGQAAQPVAGNKLKGVKLPPLVVGSEAPVLAAQAMVARAVAAPGVVAPAAAPASAPPGAGTPAAAPAGRRP
jgi:type VI secretion system protein ImpL